MMRYIFLLFITISFLYADYDPNWDCEEIVTRSDSGVWYDGCWDPEEAYRVAYPDISHFRNIDFTCWKDTFYNSIWRYSGTVEFSFPDSQPECLFEQYLDMSTCECIDNNSTTSSGTNSSGAGSGGGSNSSGSNTSGGGGGTGSAGSTGSTGGSNSSSSCPALASYQVAWITALIPSAAQCNETDVNTEGSIYVYHNHIWDTCRNQCVSTRYGCSVGLLNDGNGNCVSPNLQSGSCSNWVFSYLQGPDSSGSCYNVYTCQSDTSVPDDYIQVSCGYDGDSESSTPYASSSGNASEESQSSNAQSNAVSSNSYSSNIYPVSVSASSDSSSNVSDGSIGTGQSSTSQTSSTANTGSGSGSSTAQFSSVDFQGVYDRLDHLSDDNDKQLNRLDTLVTNTQNTNTKLDTANGHLLDILDQSKNTVNEIKQTNSNLSEANTKLSHIDAKIEESNNYLSEIQSVLENIHDALTATGTSSLGSGTGGSASSQTTTGGNGSASSASSFATSTGSGTGSGTGSTGSATSGSATSGTATSGSAGSASSDPFWTDEEYKDDYHDDNQSYIDQASGEFDTFGSMGDILKLKNISGGCGGITNPQISTTIGSFTIPISSLVNQLPLSAIQDTLLMIAAIAGFLRVFSGGD